MFNSLHTANRIARQNVCCLYNDSLLENRHYANMEPKNYLKQWREHREMTQEQLAEAAETTKSVISLLESEKRPLSSKWLRKFAEILETRPGYILDHDPNEMDADVFDIWSAIDERDRARAIDVLRAFSKTGTDD